MRHSLTLGGTAMLCCLHGIEKNRYSELIYNAAREKPSECICCGNVFAYPINIMDQPIFCPSCIVAQGGKYGREALSMQ